MDVNRVKPSEAAKLFGISHTHIYKYIYARAIPKPAIMLKIFIVTLGAVSPNDFYGATEVLLEQELLKQLTLKLEKDEQ